MNSKFKHRSQLNEMMDDPEVSEELLYKNLHELDLLNRYTLAHKKSIRALRKLVTDHKRAYHIVDLGCGSGDTLKHMAKWARKNKIEARFTGVDASHKAIAYLEKHCSQYPEITGVAMSYKEYCQHTSDVDIFHNSLFMHHLSNSELNQALIYQKERAAIGFIINDLFRSPLLYHLTRILVAISPKATVLAKNDGPVSVLRGFKLSELKKHFTEAGIINYKIECGVGFRFVATVHNSIS